jgi:hypothetical protein
MLTEADEQDPAECIRAVVETGEPEHAFLVRLRRRDGQDVSINVSSVELTIQLITEMNPAEVFLAVRGEALDALIGALTDYGAVVDDPRQRTQRRTLH